LFLNLDIKVDVVVCYNQDSSSLGCEALCDDQGNSISLLTPTS